MKRSTKEIARQTSDILRQDNIGESEKLETRLQNTDWKLRSNTQQKRHLNEIFDENLIHAPVRKGKGNDECSKPPKRNAVHAIARLHDCHGNMKH